MYRWFHDSLVGYKKIFCKNNHPVAATAVRPGGTPARRWAPKPPPTTPVGHPQGTPRAPSPRWGDVPQSNGKPVRVDSSNTVGFMVAWWATKNISCKNNHLPGCGPGGPRRVAGDPSPPPKTPVGYTAKGARVAVDASQRRPMTNAVMRKL